MLTLKLITDNKEDIISRLAIKNIDARQSIEKIIELDNARKSTQLQFDNAQAKLNSLSKQIGQWYKEGKQNEAEQAKQQTQQLKEDIKNFSTKLIEIENELENTLVKLPNIPHKSVPQGKSAEDNIIIKTWGNIPHFSGDYLPHWELAKKFDIIDFELGNMLTGSGFPVYKGKGARFQRALINFFLDEAVRAGYREIQPPLMVNKTTAYATGQLPDKDGQMYVIKEYDSNNKLLEGDNFFLIPTAEVPLTNMYRDKILEISDFPIKLTGYTPCFRREAGSYGKDVRGLNRIHQFDKVEIVQIQHPDKSYQTLEDMVNYVASIIEKLELPYRIVKLCGGDLSFTSAMTYDFEVYSAAQQKWLEVSSVSNFETFQSNRLNLRFREPNDKKPKYAHTLNGSALALPRIVAALIENNQTPNSIAIPKVLHDYLGFTDIV